MLREGNIELGETVTDHETMHAPLDEELSDALPADSVGGIIAEGKAALVALGVAEFMLEDMLIIDPEIFRYAVRWVSENIHRDCGGQSFVTAFVYGTSNVPPCRMRDKLRTVGIMLPRMQSRNILVAFVSQVKIILTTLSLSD